MMDRVHRPVCAVVLVLSLCAPVAWCAEGDSPPSMPTVADVLKQAEQMRQAMNESAQARQEAMEAAGMKPSSPDSAAAPSKGSKARGAKKASVDAKEKPKGFSDIRVTLEGSFDLHVQGEDIRIVLRQLSAQAKKNIVTSNQVSGTVTADLYNVDFEEALDAVTKAAGLTCQTLDDVVYVFTPAEIALRRDEMPIEVRVFHLAYLRAATARDLINGMLSPKGKATITPEEHTNIEALPTPTWDQQRLRNVAEDVLVVYDYEYVLEKIAKVIKKVDVKPEQVLIEATILSAELSDDNALGVDLQGLIGTSFNTFGAMSNLTNLTVPAPPAGGVRNFSHWQSRINSGFTQNMPNTFGPPFTFGIVYDNVGMFIQALESVRDVTVLANPKILIVNKQRGEVLVGRADGYLTTVVTDTSAIQQVEFLETGTRLIVRPFIGTNENIRLEIHPEDSNGSVAPVEEGGPALPRKTTTQVTTNIIVRDGKTVVIAGLFRDQVQTTRRQVPILGDIPWMGTLFRSTVDATTRAEVIILITPHIVRDASAEAVGERMRCVTERYRIGAREGLRWWGRNRLSAEYLKRANQCWSEGDMDKTNWWLDLCLTLQPDLVEAMLLKERLTDEASWTHPPQFTDSRYIITRMLMQEIGRDVDTIIIPQRPLHDSELRPEVRKALGVELKPKTPGVITRKGGFSPATWRDDATVPRVVDMKPTPAPQAPSAPPAKKTEEKPKAPPKPKTEATPAQKSEPVKKPKPPARKPEPVKEPEPTKKPEPPARKPEPVKKPEPTKEPAKPAPSDKVPAPEVKEKPKAPEKTEPKPSPESRPGAEPTKAPEESDKPRLAPIEDQPVTPAPESSLSSKAKRTDSAPFPTKMSASDSPPPLSVTESDETKSDLPKIEAKPATEKPKTDPPKVKSNSQPVPETPVKKSDDLQSLLKPDEQNKKSTTQRFLESGTLSVLLEQPDKK